MDKILHETLLYDFYADLLTEKQRNICKMHFCEDMSLAEIGDLLGISRQAVNASLRQARASFSDFERALGLVDYHLYARARLTELRKALEEQKYTKSIELLNELEKKLLGGDGRGL